MIREIENRRSIRKYKPDEIERKLIEEIIYSANTNQHTPFEEIVEYR